MNLTRINPKTETEEFIAKFPKDKFSYYLLSDMTGNIIKASEIKDKQIIAWLKEKGFKE